ncbi:MAG: hypothetical protein GTO03_08905 [Planctomycetales bacterium]|nr:hypothetical protein [Planctomycetales bacterium]
MISPKLLSRLLLLAVLLPLVLSVSWGVSQLLAAMQDAAWAAILQRIGLLTGVAWGVVLIGLVLALAIRALTEDARSDPPHDS